MRPTRFVLPFTALLLTVGCGGAQTSVPAPSPTLRATTVRRGPVVEQSEIQAAVNGSTAMDAVRRLRPEFLNRHAEVLPWDAEQGYAVVYLDGVRLGGLETLEGIPVTTIVEIRYLRANAAIAQFGKNHRGGVILVSTIR